MPQNLGTRRDFIYNLVTAGFTIGAAVVLANAYFSAPNPPIGGAGGGGGSLPDWIFEDGASQSPNSYTVYSKGGFYFAKNGQTGKNDFSGTDAPTVIQNAMTALNSVGGGVLFIKDGIYILPVTSQVSPLLLTFYSDVAVIGESRDGTILEFTNAFGVGASGGYTVIQNQNTSISSGGDSGIHIENLTITGFWVGTVTAYLELKFFGVHRSHMRNVVVNKMVVVWRQPDDWTGASWATQNVYTTPTNVLAYDCKFVDCIFNQCASVQSGLYRSHQTRCKHLQAFDDSCLVGSWGKEIYFDHCDFDLAGVSGAYGAATAHLNILNDNSTGFGNDPKMIEVWATHCNFRNGKEWVTGNRAGVAVQGGTFHSDHCLFEFNRVAGVFVTHGIWDSYDDIIQFNDGLGALFAQDTLIPGNMSGKYGGTKYLPLSHLSATVFRDNFQDGSLAPGQGLTEKGGLGYFNSATAGNQNLGGLVIEGNCQFIDDQAVATQVNGVEISIANSSLNAYVTIRDDDFSQQPTAQITLTGANALAALVLIGRNRGYNPKGWATASPAVPASGVDETNTTGYPVLVYITGLGTGITAVGITDNAATLQSFTRTGEVGDFYRLEPNDKIRLTYTGSPTWKWFGL